MCRPALSFLVSATSTAEIYTLSLHDALPILLAADPDLETRPRLPPTLDRDPHHGAHAVAVEHLEWVGDRKSTRLNSSHLVISYAVFCLKKKKKQQVGRK